jgi:hypothetical protein
MTLRAYIMPHALNVDPPKVRKVVEAPIETLKKYVGSYALNLFFKFTVTLIGDQLKVKLTGQDAYPVYPSSPTESTKEPRGRSESPNGVGSLLPLETFASEPISPVAKGSRPLRMASQLGVGSLVTFLNATKNNVAQIRSITPNAVVVAVSRPAAKSATAARPKLSFSNIPGIMINR